MKEVCPNGSCRASWTNPHDSPYLYGPGRFRRLSYFAIVTTSRRPLLWEATGWSTLVVITLIAGRGPLFQSPLSVAVLITMLITTVGLVASIAQGRSGTWSAAPLVAAPLLAVPFAAAVQTPSIRTLAVAVAPLTIAGIAVWQRHIARSTAWWIVGAAALTVFVDLAFRDPYRELNCRPICPVSPWAIDHRAGLLDVTGWMLLAVVLVCSAMMLRNAISGNERVGTLPATLAAGGLITCAMTRVVRSSHRPDDMVVSWLSVASVLCVGALAAMGLWPIIRSYLGRRRVQRWLVAVDGAAQGDGVVELLRDAAHDPQLEFVDSPDPRAGRVTTTLRRGAHPVAIVEHRPESADRLRAALSPTMIALVENDVLVAEAARQLDQLRATRREAIERTDDARRQLQRDLHDGAQQHLLALGMALSALATDAPDPARTHLDEAVQRAAHALERLRAVAHSSTPPVLDDIGLDEALRSLAEACAVDLDLHLPTAPNGRQRRDIEQAAYRLVADVVAGAAETGAERLTVRLDRDDGLVVTASHPTTDGAVRTPGADRIEAAGGTLAASVESGYAVYRARFP